MRILTVVTHILSKYVLKTIFVLIKYLSSEKTLSRYKKYFQVKLNYKWSTENKIIVNEQKHCFYSKSSSPLLEDVGRKNNNPGAHLFPEHLLGKHTNIPKKLRNAGNKNHSNYYSST